MPRIRNNRETRRGIALIVKHLNDNWPTDTSLDDYQAMRQAFGWMVQTAYGEIDDVGLDPDLILGDMVEV